ncbi:hypothetical protein SBOR_4491 [Sclerotinia borealis F-4128]|uniref:Uncharacterized protein n=1 Tax=Sclerotinia borealis (strain F-4128) TaxID=1432307 RepID=W9CKD0_SCLBF|nr:hypothetical protein SBOR_4491 [Sclerotinia borealis F-4128]
MNTNKPNANTVPSSTSSSPSQSITSQSKSNSTPHLPISRPKCIYLLTAYTCSHFVQPFTNPTNIIHTPTCMARYGGMCSSDGYRYEFLRNGGEVCGECRGKGRMEGEESEYEKEVEFCEQKTVELREEIGNAKNEDYEDMRTRGNGRLTAPEFLIKESRSLTEVASDYRSMKSERRSQRSMIFEYQRAVPSRRPTIGENRQVSTVIEEGWEYNGEKYEMANSRCMVGKGKKRWEDLWEKLKKL